MNNIRKPIILIVDDNPHNLQVLAELTEESGYEMALALSGIQALDYISQEKPDLILLDIMMPELDGYEVCMRLNADSTTKDIPVIFLTAKTETEDIVKGFEVGCVDYILKPFNGIELKARIKKQLEIKEIRDNLQQYNEKLQKANIELQKANEIISMKSQQLREVMVKMEELATKDTLTNLYNRRYMIEKMEEEVVKYRRKGRSFVLVMADIDYFKKVNDSYGHHCGDLVLKSVAQIMQETVRVEECIARWGGEEFLILLPETDLAGGEILAERIRNKIESNVLSCDGNQIVVTMTLGVAKYDGDAGIDECIKKADNALYSGKASGRNCVVVAK